MMDWYEDDRLSSAADRLLFAARLVLRSPRWPLVIVASTAAIRILETPDRPVMSSIETAIGGITPNDLFTNWPLIALGLLGGVLVELVLYSLRNPLGLPLALVSKAFQTRVPTPRRRKGDR
jgi:hypothetical protein